jgi:hypothetical protein
MSNKKNRGNGRHDAGTTSPGGVKGSQGRPEGRGGGEGQGGGQGGGASAPNKERALGDQSRRSDENQAKMRGGMATSTEARREPPSRAGA